jgi:SAM-dependent methyltransferase
MVLRQAAGGAGGQEPTGTCHFASPALCLPFEGRSTRTAAVQQRALTIEDLYAIRPIFRTLTTRHHGHYGRMETLLDYLMENDEEIVRLEIKTDIEAVHRQARWAGLEPGMRVADIGCGPGKTSRALLDLVGPGGEVVGIDIALQRIAYAQEKYGTAGLRFEHRNAIDPLDDLGSFDFVWVRFLLEYHRNCSFKIVQNLSGITNPGGVMCLIDLDRNCLNHFGLPQKLSEALMGIMQRVEQYANFDPYVGIKLYAFLYDLGYEAIDVRMEPHHLIFGELNEVDAFNWTKKVEVAAKNSGYPFEQYPGGYDAFFEDFKAFFAHPRRFTYTPLIACRGRKPSGLN